MTAKQSLLLLCIASCITPAYAGEKQDIKAIHKELSELKKTYQDKIKELEQRLSDAEDATDDVSDQTQQLAIDLSQQANRTAANTFNPGIGVVLNGRYTHMSPANYEFSMPGFTPAEESGPGDKGFSLGESEIHMATNIDDKFYGTITLSFGDSVSVEQAFIQTISLPDGLGFKFGHFFSDIGYLNSRHSHTDDFAFRPLAYQAFLGPNFADDGVQFTWLAPTNLFWETGVELYKGSSFPGSGNAHNGIGTKTIFTHIGGDIGLSQSWRAGISYLTTNAIDRTDPQTETSSFTGDSDLWIADFVWKWAPDGNTKIHNAKIQGEFFKRHEKGLFSSNGLSPMGVDSNQQGWYLQGVYQFIQQWRVGLRYEQLQADKLGSNFTGTMLDNRDHDPHQLSLMMDWSNSEFSRVRLQFSKDNTAPQSANLITLQYIAAFGAHGAHAF